MRALLKPFALHAAYTPIETIVFFCIVGTLAYFHILNAIKHSAFLSSASTPYTPVSIRPAYVLLRPGEWVIPRESTRLPVRTGERSNILELQQLVITLASPRGEVSLFLSQGTMSKFLTPQS